MAEAYSEIGTKGEVSVAACGFQGFLSGFQVCLSQDPSHLFLL